MPNDFTTNPLQIDTASDGIAFNGERKITSVIVIASADNWSFVLRNVSGGRVLFRADSNIANHRSVYWSPAGEGVPDVYSVYAATLTNITLALVYLDRTVGSGTNDL